MHFAQKYVRLQRGLGHCERGVIHEADICEYKDAVSASWDASFVQLGAGKLDAELDFLIGPGFSLYRESWCQRLHLVGTLLPGMIAIGIPAQQRRETRWWGFTAPSDCIPIARSTSELNLVAAANEAITVLTMREVDFLEIFERLTGLPRREFPEQGHFLQVKAGAAQRVLDFWNSVLAKTSALDTCEWGVADLVAPLLDALELAVIPHRLEVRKSALVERLLRIAEASDFKASVPEISRESNVSRRTIEYVFRDLLGESPRAYFTARRMNLCQQELAAASREETTVATIAIKYGFCELGRFAALYRRYFGELPSSTLRQTRGLVDFNVHPHLDGTIEGSSRVPGFARAANSSRLIEEECTPVPNRFVSLADTHTKG